MPRPILILTAPTGGGHDSVAIALRQALEAIGIQSRVASPLGPTIGHLYGWALNHAPSLWGAAYQCSNHRFTVSASGRLTLGDRALRQMILDLEPRLILSVHALCAQSVARVLAGRHSLPRHHCVVTDMVSIHRSWAMPSVDQYYVPTWQAALALARFGVPAAGIQVTGLPVRRPFWPGAQPLASPRDQDSLRVLIMDGGTPGPALARAAAALARTDLPLSLSLARGDGDPERGCWPMATSSAGQSTTMDLFPPSGSRIAAEMAAAQVVVTKAGSVSIAEALALGRPLIIHRVAPGQEVGNPAYLEGFGAGATALDSAALVIEVRDLLLNPRRRLAMAERAAAIGRPLAARQIAERVAEVLSACPTAGAVAG